MQAEGNKKTHFQKKNLQPFFLCARTLGMDRLNSKEDEDEDDRGV